MRADRGRRGAGPSGDPWRPRDETFLLRAILRVTDALRVPLAAFGIDPPRFRELLRTRIVLAQRPGGDGGNVWGSAGAVLAVLMTWFAGFLSGLVAVLTHDARLWVLVSQGLATLMLVVLLFQVLAGILVDPTDIGVVSPHPVSDRTVFAVRLAEVTAYVLVFALTFTAGAVVLPLFALPPLAVLLVYPVLALSNAAIALGAVALLFALCLRLVGPTHFQRVALWLQIVGGIAVFAAFQASRAVPREQWSLWWELYGGFRRYVPVLAHAELFAFASGERADVPAVEALVAFALPVAALAVTFLLASRYFVAGLQGTLGAPVRRSGWEQGLLSRIGARLRGREERAGFDFALALSRREPHLLRGLLPQLAMFQAMGIGWAGIGTRRDLALYLPISAGFLFMLLPNLLLQAQSTSAPEARVLFATAPLESEDALLRGGTKALLLQWVAVPAVVLCAAQLWIAGPGGVPRIVLAFELSFAATLVFTRIFHVGVPFTRSIRVGETNAANLGWILMMTFAMGAIVVLHLALSLHPLALALGIAGTGFLDLVLWRRLGGLKVAPDRRLLVPRTRLVVE